jgi:hypothetical protein
MGIDVHVGAWYVSFSVWELLAFVGAAVIVIATVIAGCRRLAASKSN